jgi:hypothetical protein
VLNGCYSLQIIGHQPRSVRLEQSRSGTADENKAVAQGTISYFGTYSVDEAGKTINLRRRQELLNLASAGGGGSIRGE